MSRRNNSTVDDLFEIFVLVPWWIGPIVAALVYWLMAYVGPHWTTNSDNILVKSMFTTMFRTLAPFVTGGVVIIWVVAMVAKLRGRLILNRQTGFDSLQSLSWQDFENLIAAAYRQQGYRVVNTGPGADGGADLVMYRDGQEYVVQCKHWKSTQVGVSLVRELHGITHSREHAGSQGVFVTFGEYTADARDFAEDNGIELVDRSMLLEMIRSAQRDSNTHRDPAALVVSLDPKCPKCGGDMVLKTAKRGLNAGRNFWSCSRWPQCEGARDAERA